MRLPFAAVLVMLATSALANEGVAPQPPLADQIRYQVVQLDVSNMCIYAGIPYSVGSRLDGFVCKHTGNRTDGNGVNDSPVEWERDTTF